MAERRDREIVLKGAREHNLRDIDVRIPRGSLTVITGVSGSGKSSLAFDTLFREGQRRFLETLPSYARQFVSGLARPAFTSIEGLGPAVAVAQRSSLSNPRSTVGTLTEVWDLLRLLFARLGEAPKGIHPTRGLFSFNGSEGACPHCQGLGVEDRLDLELLVADATKTLREGALRVSTPNGYLMYSQVTLQVMDEVLHAHGGSVDIPWRDLSEEARHVVLYGSERLKVPYGKHPLESRLKWTGIKAKPRQDGFYRGLVPVMEDILRGKRNDSILRFVRSDTCSACKGARLSPEALAVRWNGRTIVDLASMTVEELRDFLASVHASPREETVLGPIRSDILARCELMGELGLGYLSFDRSAPTLSRGEVQRLRLLGLALGELRGLLVVLDEPSAGLHPQEVNRLVKILKRLRDQGQTVVVVEHDASIAKSADWLVDLGPGPGALGGELLWSGPPAELMAQQNLETPTKRWLQEHGEAKPAKTAKGGMKLCLHELKRHNLKNISMDMELSALNLVTGLSGAGKTSLLDEVVERFKTGAVPDSPFRRVVRVDADPIGRTPRSNAATYTGAFDLIRDLFAATPQAKAMALGKGHFSFNTAGGRCEACEGAGVIEVGMRYLGSVDLPCESCGGRRFHKDVLEVKYRERNIADVLEGSILEAVELFRDQPKLKKILVALLDVGLGYLPLGQPATTLSGGEAQRVKLATELAKAGSGSALIALDEPTTGLHAADVDVLLEAWDRLLEAGHTLLVVDNDSGVVHHADHVTVLGPGSGPQGGRVVASGRPETLMGCELFLTGAALDPQTESKNSKHVESPEAPMELHGVCTHNLKNMDVSIPARGLTVVTGPSGCGKSSLVFDTLLAEAQNRFADLVSPWARRLLPRKGGAELILAQGLQAAIAVPQQAGRRNPRSTVGTVTELEELLRLLFARAGERICPTCGTVAQAGICACGQVLPVLWASSFSPHSEAGACPRCKGLGFIQRCDPERLVSHPQRSLFQGAMDGTRFGTYLGESTGQFIATLRRASQVAGLDLERPWSALGTRERELAMRGTGDVVYDVEWLYKRGNREGVHQLQASWDGFANLVDREYERIHSDEKGKELEALMADFPCDACQGERLNQESRMVRFGGLRLPEVLNTSLDGVQQWLKILQGSLEPRASKLTDALREDISKRIETLVDSGIGYLSLSREMASLSGGEAQRVRLAAALGGGLVGVTYVLDEPTQGLHPRDTKRLAGVLRDLADAGNAVVLVEHDASIITGVDHVIELGPGAGPEGGELVVAGSPEALRNDPRSRTGALLRRTLEIAQAYGSLPPGLTIRGACIHNLRNVDVEIPSSALVAVTGVSGSGKSSLVLDVLAPSLRNMLQGRGPVGCAELSLHADLKQVIAIEQEVQGFSATSNVATLMDLAEGLRKRYAATPRAKALKLTSKHFSTASPGGRCEACEGRGVITVAMDLLPDVTVGCELCQGKRFKPEVLECLLNDLSIGQLLDCSVKELTQRFAEDEMLHKPLQSLMSIGLGYLRLGQDGSALSAGELQRLRLAKLLAEPNAPRSAILLDEPTRGLGFEDVDRLLVNLKRLSEAGHMIVIVEHDLAFVSACDWVIDLGPEGGEGGGRVVVEGPPWLIAQSAESHTGRALAAATRHRS